MPCDEDYCTHGVRKCFRPHVLNSQTQIITANKNRLGPLLCVDVLVETTYVAAGSVHRYVFNPIDRSRHSIASTRLRKRVS